MTRPLRRAHSIVWPIVTALVLILLAASVWVRPAWEHLR